MNEIKELLSLRVDTHTTQAHIRERAQAKLADVEQKIRPASSVASHLEAIHASLLRTTEDCSGCGSVKDCPILECLDREDFS